MRHSPSDFSALYRPMAYLEWSDKFLTGISNIDVEHKNLFVITNVLYDNVQANGPEANIVPVLTALGEYVRKHFSSEETAMRRAEYPGIVEHIEKHRAIDRKVQAYIEQCNDDPVAVDSKELLEFLKRWLVNHVLKNDMDYVPYIKQAGNAPD